jgi:muramidase (phage lysozyme)
MNRWIRAATLATLVTTVACSAETTEDSPADTSEEGIRDAQGNEVVTATLDTALKTSTQDTSSLSERDVCRIQKGTKVKLAGPVTIGGHVRGRLMSAHGCAGKFGGGATVYVFRQHFSGWSAAPVPPPPNPNLPTCSPARAVGVVADQHKALLDTIAFAEGTRGRGQDGYNVQFTYVYFNDCTRHPRRIQSSGGLRSDASGRYQFLSSTWDTLGYSAFYPENQERGAMALVRRRGGSVPESRAMTATELANLMDRISYEWASLPPGRYGQPNYSQSRIRTEYCAVARC